MIIFRLIVGGYEIVVFDGWRERLRWHVNLSFGWGLRCCVYIWDSNNLGYVYDISTGMDSNDLMRLGPIY
ncbi:hypothetical protein TWF225_001895 [Orbilia oligospora]|nr:hypothetical protein TWF225_001895 [Orbilia oligospora]KAF3262226.1 hypothetical protein TWF217_004293 [Orbilia oligospora]KAF3265282.1 hypothetical protein TWF128_000563 [Orbilia oligospora]